MAIEDIKCVTPPLLGGERQERLESQEPDDGVDGNQSLNLRLGFHRHGQIPSFDSMEQSAGLMQKPRAAIRS